MDQAKNRSILASQDDSVDRWIEAVSAAAAAAAAATASASAKLLASHAETRAMFNARLSEVVVSMNQILVAVQALDKGKP